MSFTKLPEIRLQNVLKSVYETSCLRNVRHPIRPQSIRPRAQPIVLTPPPQSIHYQLRLGVHSDSTLMHEHPHNIRFD